MIIVMPTAAIVLGQDEQGFDMIMPMPAVAVVINEPPDASVARFIGEVRGLAESFRKDRGKP